MKIRWKSEWKELVKGSKEILSNELEVAFQKNQQDLTMPKVKGFNCAGIWIKLNSDSIITGRKSDKNKRRQTEMARIASYKKKGKNRSNYKPLVLDFFRFHQVESNGRTVT